MLLDSPTNIAIPVRDGVTRLDARQVHERMLEGLVEASRGTDRPDRIPAFSSLTLLVRQDPEGFGWAIDRLAEDDVPISLVTSVAGHFPSRDARLQEVVHRLLLPRLIGADPTEQAAALEVLRARGALRSAAEGACRCAFGVYPARPAEREPVWLVAWSLEDEPLAWSPQEEPDGWLLRLQQGSAPDPSVRVHALAASPPKPWTVRGTELKDAPQIVLAPEGD